jgi:hypothetical protein
MDNPASSKSYDAEQFLQNGHKRPTTLRATVQEIQSTGQDSSVLKCITGIVIMMQMTAKGGIRKHNKVVVDTLFEEFLQLHNIGIFLGQDGNKLKLSEKRGPSEPLT